MQNQYIYAYQLPRGAKPVNLFGQREDVVESRPFEETKAPKESNDEMDEDENPF